MRRIYHPGDLQEILEAFGDLPPRWLLCGALMMAKTYRLHTVYRKGWGIGSATFLDARIRRLERLMAVYRKKDVCIWRRE